MSQYVGGSAQGGLTFLGLGALLTKAKVCIFITLNVLMSLGFKCNCDPATICFGVREIVAKRDWGCLSTHIMTGYMVECGALWDRVVV